MGDYKNLVRTHYRQHIKAYIDDDTSQADLDSVFRGEMRKFYRDLFAPIQDRCLGVALGNHYWEFQNGTNDTQLLAELMGCAYLDKPAFIRMPVKFGNHGHGAVVLKQLVHHGDFGAGGATLGGDVGAAERRIKNGFNRFDIVWLSHTHRRWAGKFPELDIPESGTLCTIEVPRIIVRTGCFVAAYDKCTPNYAQRKLMGPTDIGNVKVEIRFRRSNRRGGDRVVPEYTAHY